MIPTRKVLLVILLALITLQLYGCGATVEGMGEDLSRMGRGVKTVFIRDN